MATFQDLVVHPVYHLGSLVDRRTLEVKETRVVSTETNRCAEKRSNI
jgi:hypothetical protein